MSDGSNFHAAPLARILFPTLAILGAAVLAYESFETPQRARANFYVAANFAAWLATGALTLIALDAITGASWSLPLRRLREACVAILPVAATALILALFAYPSLFGAPATTSEPEGLSSFASYWLQRPFFLARALVYVTLWIAFAVAIIQSIRSAERTGLGLWSRGTVALSAAFLVVFGITCWLASYDWIMALERGWSSTILGVYNFAGAILSATALVTLLAVILRRSTSLRTALSDDCLHDLGTYLFGFSSFWMYIGYCQYLLIWYTNHPDETSYLRVRLQNPWIAYWLSSVVLCWVIPFFVLLPRKNKRSGLLLTIVCLGVLAGRWLDLFVLIGPTQGTALATFGLPEATAAVVVTGVAGSVVLWYLSKAPVTPLMATLSEHDRTL